MPKRRTKKRRKDLRPKKRQIRNTIPALRKVKGESLPKEFCRKVWLGFETSWVGGRRGAGKSGQAGRLKGTVTQFLRKKNPETAGTAG